MVEADIVILLTDQEGLYTADPRLDPDAKLIPVANPIDEKICMLAGSSSTPLGIGGMATKITAAQIAWGSGIRTISYARGLIKSGNCALLCGGSEALQTNRILVEMIQHSLVTAGLPPEAIQYIAHSDRSEIKELLQLNESKVVENLEEAIEHIQVHSTGHSDGILRKI
jgi:hypothetical protein